jgi:hypothetical protein
LANAGDSVGNVFLVYRFCHHANEPLLSEFNFYPTNHSVVRAEYGFPCIPYEDTGVDKAGFFSGFRPVDAILLEPPKFIIEINDTSPIFFYCSAPGSCIGYGMVGAINPNATTSLVTQRQLAMNSTFMLQPGEPWPSEGAADPFTTTATAGATAVTTSTATSQPNYTESAGEAKKSYTLSTGTIAGIAIGGLAIVLIAAALLYFCGRRSRKNRNEPLPQHPYSSRGSKYTPQIPEHKTHMATYSGGESFSVPFLGHLPSHNSYR